MAAPSTRRVAAALGLAALSAAGVAAYQRWGRPRIHDWGATESERNRSYTGDELVPDAFDRSTYAITIDAPATDVWPWIVQMGVGRGGWYSYDLLDNFARRSADTILPEHQHVQDGDLLPTDPKKRTGFPVLRIEPERHLVLGGPVRTRDRRPLTMPGGGPTMIWAFHLIRQTRHATRLIVRTATGRAKSPRLQRVLAPWWEAVVFAMQRRQLIGIRERAEAHSHAVHPRKERGRGQKPHLAPT